MQQNRSCHGRQRQGGNFTWFGGGPALLVSQDLPPQPAAAGAGTALYCDAVHVRMGGLFE